MDIGYCESEDLMRRVSMSSDGIGMIRLLVLCTIAVSGETLAQPVSISVQMPVTSRLQILVGEPASLLIQPIIEKRPELGLGRRFAFGLVNTSERSLLAIGVRWQWTDNQGRRRTHDSRSDSLFLQTSAVLGAHQSLVVFPWMFARESAGQIALSGVASGDAVRELEGATGVSAHVDCVVFDDGVVVGPDQTETIEGIRIRRRIAGEMGRLVKAALESGRSPSEAVRAYLHQKSAPEQSRIEQKWMRLISSFVTSARFDANTIQPGPASGPSEGLGSLAERLIHLPELPSLRKE